MEARPLMWTRYLRIVVDVLAVVTDAALASCIFSSWAFFYGDVGVFIPSTGSVVVPEGGVVPGRDVVPGWGVPERDVVPELFVVPDWEDAGLSLILPIFCCSCSISAFVATSSLKISWYWWMKSAVAITWPVVKRRLGRGDCLFLFWTTCCFLASSDE